MIIPPSHFKKFFQNDQESILVAKMVDEWVIKNGANFWGELDRAGQGHNFSSYKKNSDTHHMIAFFIQEMGFEEPRQEPVKSPEITQDDIDRARAAQLERLERLYRNLENKEKLIETKVRQGFRGGNEE